MLLPLLFLYVFTYRLWRNKWLNLLTVNLKTTTVTTGLVYYVSDVRSLDVVGGWHQTSVTAVLYDAYDIAVWNCTVLKCYCVIMLIMMTMMVIRFITLLFVNVWHGGVMVLYLRWRGHGFDSQPLCFHVMTLGVLFRHMSLSHQAV